MCTYQLEMRKRGDFHSNLSWELVTQRELFLFEVNNRTTTAAIEANNDTIISKNE